MANEKATQAKRILDYMGENGGITQLEALSELGCMRLASRISDLRRQGHGITSETVAIINRYGEVCHIKRYHSGGQLVSHATCDKRLTKRELRKHYKFYRELKRDG